MIVRHISEIYAARRTAGRPVISFEFFPPKTPAGDDRLFRRVLPRLAAARPDFCSVTYGAGGGSRTRTLDLVDRIQREFGLVGLAHLTCLTSTVPEIRAYLTEAEARDIRNVLALRGDPPPEATGPAPSSSGFDYAYQLIDFIKAQVDDTMSIGCAGFPECHITCTDGKHVDWQRLRDKVTHGAQFVLTQLFFDNADYFEMVDYLTTRLGVEVPITPGVLPILNGAQIKRFTALCGATIPAELADRLDALGDDDEAVTRFGIDYASRQCEALLAGGAPGLHVYTLNRSRSALAILRNLGLTAADVA